MKDKKIVVIGVVAILLLAVALFITFNNKSTERRVLASPGNGTCTQCIPGMSSSSTPDGGNCWCDEYCVGNGDCCNNYQTLCQSGGNDYYTKAEIDSKLLKIVTDAVSTKILDIRSLNNSIRFQATDVSSVTMNGKFIADDLISRNSLSTNYLKASDISTYTIKTALTGNGTAYACLDSDGKLFRSLTACR